jgi:putative NIF3 family GTP cyclohydrolase 1 type 2
VEGRAEIGRLVAGVTASQKLLDAAVRVVPMPFWCIMAISGKVRMAASPACAKTPGTLLANDINLLAYHLPLDAASGTG